MAFVERQVPTAVLRNTPDSMCSLRPEGLYVDDRHVGWLLVATNLTSHYNHTRSNNSTSDYSSRIMRLTIEQPRSRHTARWYENVGHLFVSLPKRSILSVFYVSHAEFPVSGKGQ